MAEVFYIKRGSRKYGIEYKLDTYQVGSGQLSGATARFRAMDENGTTVIDGAATIADADGILRYAFGAGETDTARVLRGEFDITYSDGLLGTVPSRGFITIVIGDDVQPI